MIVECPRCHAQTEATITGHNRYTTTISQDVLAKCEVIRARMEANGGMTKDIDCDHIDKAIDQAVNRARGRR